MVFLSSHAPEHHYKSLAFNLGRAASVWACTLKTRCAHVELRESQTQRVCLYLVGEPLPVVRPEGQHWTFRVAGVPDGGREAESDTSPACHDEGRGGRLSAPPVIVAADLRGGLDHSTIKISFHYLSPDLVDREGIGVLTDFSTWSAQEAKPLNALVHADLDGKHGDRSFVPGTGDDLEMVEAQSNSASP